MWPVVLLSGLHQILLLFVHFAILVVLAADALLALGGKKLLLLQLRLSFVHLLYQKTLKKMLLASISPKVLNIILALYLESLRSLLKLSKVLA